MELGWSKVRLALQAFYHVECSFPSVQSVQFSHSVHLMLHAVQIMLPKLIPRSTHQSLPHSRTEHGSATERLGPSFTGPTPHVGRPSPPQTTCQPPNLSYASTRRKASSGRCAAGRTGTASNPRRLRAAALVVTVYNQLRLVNLEVLTTIIQIYLQMLLCHLGVLLTGD